MFPQAEIYIIHVSLDIFFSGWGSVWKCTEKNVEQNFLYNFFLCAQVVSL